ncbi:hypothetical protein [Candidatus Thioglobus sp.]|uniref:hypothetical protein n=1 Tax=Candidatus Thioglobus sp. TaxID=2026721 RepID=UPI003D0B4843
MKKLLSKATGLVALGSGAAFAEAPDYSTLTTSVDFSTATTAILVVAASLMVVYVTFKGAKLVMSAVRGG